MRGCPLCSRSFVGRPERRRQGCHGNIKKLIPPEDRINSAVILREHHLRRTLCLISPLIVTGAFTAVHAF